MHVRDQLLLYAMLSAFVVSPLSHAPLFTPKYVCARRRYTPNMADVVASPLRFVCDSPEHAHLLRDASQPCSLPALVYVAGLDAQPLPECQCCHMRGKFAIVSVCHEPDDKSEWEALVAAALSPLSNLAANTGPITLVGESFGAALALRIAAVFSDISQLVLVNSGTALLHDAPLRTITELLPVLRADVTGRILYRAAAIFLFKVMLTREERLAESSVPSGLPWLRSVDIKLVPLEAMLHRVALLRKFETSFTDKCVRELIRIPTLLIASGKDRLLRSRKEANRLAELLPKVKRIVVLEESGHAALLEGNVNLLDIIGGGKGKSFKQSLPSKLNTSYEDAISEGRRIFGPWHKITSPLLFGKHHVKAAMLAAENEGRSQRRPVLFVGNHGVFGILDLSILYWELTDMLGKHRLRSLADPIHFQLFSEISHGRWENFITALGGVQASPRNFYRLLSAGENVLLFPGGAREVCRRRGENYQLFWKSNVDFLRPAARFDAIIVPFSTIGADDSVDILMDGQEIQQIPFIGEMVQRFLDHRDLSRANLMPIASLPPRPDRFYFKFHEPIDTLSTDPKDFESCRQKYERVKEAVQTGILDLLKERDRDPNRSIDVRIRQQILEDMRDPFRKGSVMHSILHSLLPNIEI